MESAPMPAATSLRPPGIPTRLRVLGLTQSATSPASRFRFLQFVPYLERAGWQVVHRPNRPDREWRSHLRTRPARAVHYRLGRGVMRLNRLQDVAAASGYDVVFVNRDLTGGRGRFFETRLLRENPRVVFDFDDAIFLGKKNAALVQWLCEHAAWVTPGNEYLAEWARRYSAHVTVIPTVIDTDRYLPRVWPTVDRTGPLRIGWTGSDSSIRTTLFPYLGFFAELQRQLDFELVVMSNTIPAIPTAGLRWSFHPWAAEDEGRLAEHFDVGIMPLVDNVFERGKCGLKLLQCMAAGLPTVASPVGVNAGIVVEGVTGFSAATPEAWRQAIRALVQDPELRARMGQAGRVRCEADFSLRRWLPVLAEILGRVAADDSA